MAAFGEGGAATAAEAIRLRPLRFVVSMWPLRTLAYVVSGVMAGLVTLVWLPVALVLGAVVLTPWLVRPLAYVERRRAALLGGPALPGPHRRPGRPGFAGRLRARYAETATWRELAYLVLNGSVLPLINLLALVFGLTPLLVFMAGATSVVSTTEARGVAVAPASGADAVALGIGAAAAVMATAALLGYVTALVGVAHGELARLMLAAEDDARVRTLTRSRARLIDAFEVERRRIERDLHDGAQQRLLRLGMILVTAQLELEADPEAAKPLIREATDEAKAALTELRELVRGINPQVLTELGVGPAVAELAGRSPVPVSVDLRIPGRLPGPVESTAYFVIAEALANAAKHARAAQVHVTGAVSRGALVVEVRDDGVGGADPANGTGLRGLADRVDALDGILALASPDGGPTTLRLELPCSG